MSLSNTGLDNFWWKLLSLFLTDTFGHDCPEALASFVILQGICGGRSPALTSCHGLLQQVGPYSTSTNTNRYFAIKKIGYQDLGAENLLRVTKPNGYIMGSRSQISESTFLSFVNNMILSPPPTLPPSRKVYDRFFPFGEMFTVISRGMVG